MCLFQEEREIGSGYDYGQVAGNLTSGKYTMFIGHVYCNSVYKLICLTSVFMNVK